MQNISGNELPLDRTNYFTEINHPGIQLENKQTSEMLFKAINQLFIRVLYGHFYIIFGKNNNIFQNICKN